MFYYVGSILRENIPILSDKILWGNVLQRALMNLPANSPSEQCEANIIEEAFVNAISYFTSHWTVTVEGHQSLLKIIVNNVDTNSIDSMTSTVHNLLRSNIQDNCILGLEFMMGILPTGPENMYLVETIKAEFLFDLQGLIHCSTENNIHAKRFAKKFLKSVQTSHPN